MTIKKLSIALSLFAAFGLMACGDDSSSGSAEKNLDPSPNDPVKCVFEEADEGLTFTKTLTIENKNSGEIETIETKGSCIKDECTITTSSKNHVEEDSNISFEEDGKIDEFYQNAFKDKKNLHKEDCALMDGKTRQNYEDYVALMESISCTVDDSTETHYKHTLTKDGKDGVTEYTLDGTTITISLAEPIASEGDSRCPDDDDIKNDEKQVTCDKSFITTKSKIESKDEEEAQKKFAQLIKGSYGACKAFIK